MDLIIENRIILAPISTILHRLKNDCNNRYLDFIGNETDSGVKITCPYHKDGHEKHPDCWVYNLRDNDKIYYGTVHCFSCGIRRPLYNLVGFCLGLDDAAGKEWLVDNFGENLLDLKLYIEPLSFNFNQPNITYLDESILDSYNYYHPYILSRKISEEVCRKFKIGYDIDNDMVTFPIWDFSGGLIGINKRSTKGKFYDLAKGINKAVYLLNFIREDSYNNINYPYVAICESLINALTCWTHGVPAVALMGTGSNMQYEILRNSGINNFVLLFDGDAAGLNGAHKFIKNMNNGSFITDIRLPIGKDVNDLSYNLFEDLLNLNGVTWRIKN